MSSPMNLYKDKRSGFWHIRFSRDEKPPNGGTKSTKTKDKKKANEILRIVLSDWHETKLIELNEHGKYVSLSQFKKTYLENRKDKAEDTRRADELALDRLQGVIGDKKLPFIKNKDIDTFKNILLAQDLKENAINVYLRHIRAALNVAHDWKYIDEKLKIKMLKTPKRKPVTLTREEIKTVKEYAEKHDYEIYRYIVFALWTGCRRQEILHSKYQYIKNDMIRIIGKGDKERLVPLHDNPELRLVIGRADIGPIFEQFHKDTISRRVKKIFRALNLSESLKFHCFRHSAATYMLDSDLNIVEVQKILGHSDIRTTLIYADVLEEKLKKSIQKLSFE